MEFKSMRIYLLSMLVVVVSLQQVFACSHKDHQQEQEQKDGQLAKQHEQPRLGRSIDLANVESGTANELVEHQNANLVRHQRSIQPSEQQQMLQLEDVRMLKRQLPELITQPRNDKAIERVLLKMLINASQQGNLQQQSRQQQVLSPVSYNNFESRGFVGGWQPESSLVDASEQQTGGRMLANLEQALDNYAGFVNSLPSSSNTNNNNNNDQLAFLQHPQLTVASGGEQYGLMDKRDSYTKPCSFNMISCAKNTFHSPNLRKIQ